VIDDPQNTGMGIPPAVGFAFWSHLTVGPGDNAYVAYSEAGRFSVYRFEEQRHSEVGKSTDSLAVAGIDKKGKSGSGQLKGKRNPESDRAAVVSSATWVQAVSAQLAPDLPSIAAARGVRQQNTATALQDAPEWMKKLMAK